MSASTTGPERTLRADARRNRDAVADAAAQLFTERGIDAPLDEVARRAGVGIGTLYRHFPTRDALVEAVYRREVEMLCAGVDDLLAAAPPDEALVAWMRSFTEHVARKRGMAMALKAVLGANNELFASSHQQIRQALGTLVDAAVRADAIRSDIDPEDLLRAVGGICMTADTSGPGDRTARLVDLVMDGLRYRAPVSD